MAKVRDTATTFFAVDVLDCVVRLPTHQANDLLLMVVSKDDATGGTLTTPAGWTKGGENAVGVSGNNTVRSAWYYLLAASSAETEPTVSSTDADTWTAVCVSIRDVNTSSPIDTSNTNGVTDSSGNPYTAASVTTGFNNSLVFYTCGSDGGVSPVAIPGFITLGISDSGGDATAIAYKVQRTAGASGTCDFWASTTADESVLFTIAVRDGSSGAVLPGYPNSDVATIVRPLKGANIAITSDTLDANSNSFTQLAGTWANPGTVYQVDASPLTYTDITAAATDATDADTVPYPATEAVGDFLAIGYSSAFRALRFDRAGCTNGAGGLATYEYLSTSGSWKTLSEVFDSTNSFKAALADHHICGWSLPGDWTSQSLNGVSAFWIRIRCTTVWTTNPTISQIFVSTSLALHHDTLTGLADTGVIPLFDSAAVTPAFSGNLLSGGSYVLASVVNLSSALLLGTYIFNTPRDYVDMGFRSDGGVALGLLDSTNKVKAWVVGASDTTDTYADKRNIFAIQVGQSTDTSLLGNAPTMSDVKRILLMANSRYGACNVGFNQLVNVGTLKISGGGSTTPVDYDEIVRVANGYPVPMIDRATNVAYVPIQIGGDQAVNCQASGFTLTFARQSTVANKTAGFHVDENVVGLTIDARAGDTVKLTSGKITSLSSYRFEFAATASASATYDFAGLVVERAVVTLRAVFTFSGMSFVSCPTFTQNAAVIDSCNFTNTKITSTDLSKISNCNFTSGGTGHAIEITTPGTYAFDGNIFTGYGSTGTTDATIYNNSGGLVTINLQNVTDTVPTYRNGAGASTVVNAPTADLTVTSDTASTLLQIFDTGTQTVLASTTGTTLTYTHSGETVDIVAQKAGKIPQRVTGVSLAGDVSQTFVMQTDNNYNASHGLTYTTDASWSRSLNQLTVPTWGPSVRNVYSLMIDAFISETSLRNTAFNLTMNGPQSLFLTNGAEGATDASITNMTGGGVRYVSGAGATTAEFVGFVSTGVASGSQAEYELIDGGAIYDARATGNLNEIIKLYGDASHGNFDYRDQIEFKVQRNGYRQAEVDVNAAYAVSALDPVLYIIALVMPAIDGLTLGNPSPTGLSITDDSAAPVSWDAGDGAKDYSLTITDTGSNSGETILRWLNYNLSLDATFQGRDPFEWPEMVIDNGAAYETLIGNLHKTGGDVVVGVRVIRPGPIPHPDFTRFQSDDGTYGTPPITASISVSGMPTAGNLIRLQISNETGRSAAAWQASTAYAAGDKVRRTTGIGSESTAGLYFVATTGGTTGGTEPTWDTTVGDTTADGTVVWTCYAVLFYDDDPASAGYSTTYTNGLQFIGGDSVRVRFAELDADTSFKSFSTNITATTSGFSVDVDEEADAVYAANGIDGSDAGITGKFTADYANNQIDLDANSDFTAPEAYAFFCQELTQSTGLYFWYGGISAIDVGNYRNNTDVVSIYFDETAGFVKQTDSARWYRSDGARPALDPTTGGAGIEINWKNPVYVQAVGSAVLPADITAIADEVRVELTPELTEIGDIKDIVEADEIHTGTTIQKRLKGTATPLLTKNWTGTPLSNFEAVE